MRYYCESSLESVNHVTPSVLMLDEELQRKGTQLQTILDLGCGNGRNSLYLAKKYNADVVLVDCDKQMLDWAEELFRIQGLSGKAVCTTVEELASDTSRLEKMGISKFDVVILSYVVQHIDPVYYPIVMDFCQSVCKGYLIVDVFWNPSRLGPRELATIGSVNWYGLTYEELVTLVAPRFSIVNDRVLKTDISVVINMALTEGQTPLESVLNRSYEYYSGRISRYRSGGTGTRRIRKIVNIDELECTKLLSSLYLGEFDLVKAEMMQWVQSSERILPSLMAARFLWLCRTNKIPVMFKEVARDYGISTRKLMQILSETDYVPALGPTDYIDRLAKQLYLSDAIRDNAKNMIGESLGGSSPTVRACCAVLKAAKAQGIEIKKSEIASALEVSTVAINLALKNEQSDIKTLTKSIPSV